MFNSPRPAQRYGANSGLGSSFVDDAGPLATSVYDGLDPWSAAPTPSPPPIATGHASMFSSIGEAVVPAVYNNALSAVDPSGVGEISVSALSRVVGTSGLPAAIVDRIVNLVSSKPRVSKLEFFVALALVALAQAGKDISVEHVAALASSESGLPEPYLDLSSLPPSSSDFVFGQQANGPPMHMPLPTYGSSDDPWNTSARTPNLTRAVATTPGFGASNTTTHRSLPAATSGIAGTGLPEGWWKRQENVTVSIKGQQGFFILSRYTVYNITSSKGALIPRRYSEFVILLETLARRYPFRLLPSLPPKRIGSDEYFLEQRRKGLTRFLNFVANHPILKDDGLVAVFLTEPSFEEWRRHSSISLEEESTSKRLDRGEEMAIPSDLEEKLSMARNKVTTVIDHWQKVCVFAERMVKRREAAAADTSRLINTVKALNEANERCWRGDQCELCLGVNKGIAVTATLCQRHSDLLEQRSRVLSSTTLEALKSQRDLHMALRDLFIRHDRLAVDQVDKLKKNLDITSIKMDGIKTAQKPGWQQEADRLALAIEKDQATISAQLQRRVFIRACMWHELRVVLHNRQNALLTQALRTFASEERMFSELVASNWASLDNALDEMPYE